MDHIVATIHPFVIEQEVCVYQNGECVKTVKCNLDDVHKVCMKLCKEFDIHTVDIGGHNQLYSMHIKDKIVEDNFDNFAVEVNVF